MRILVLIIMVINFLIGSAAAIGTSVKIKDEMSSIEESKKSMEEALKSYEGIAADSPEIQAKIKEAKDSLEELPSSGMASISSIIGYLLAILALVTVVFAFMKKELVQKLAFGLIGLSILFWLLTPSIDLGMLGGANPKQTAMVTAIFLVVSGACAFFSYKLYLKKLETATV